MADIRDGKGEDAGKKKKGSQIRRSASDSSVDVLKDLVVRGRLHC